MHAEIMVLPTAEGSFDYFLRLDGKTGKSVEEQIAADFPVYEVIVAFCPCAIHRSSGECVAQSLALDAGGRSYDRQPHCHLTAKSRDDGNGDSGDDDGGGGGKPCDICGQPVCLTPRFCNLCRLSDAGRLVFLFGGRQS